MFGKVVNGTSPSHKYLKSAFWGFVKMFGLELKVLWIQTKRCQNLSFQMCLFRPISNRKF